MKVDGFKQLDTKLLSLEAGPDDRDIADALMAGVRIIGDEERRLIPVASGRGRDSIVETMEPGNLPADGRSAYVGPASSPGFDPYYLRFVEFGTDDQPARPFGRQAVATRGRAALDETSKRLLKATTDKVK